MRDLRRGSWLLKHWDRGFESHSGHGRVFAPFCVVCLVRIVTLSGSISRPRIPTAFLHTDVRNCKKTAKQNFMSVKRHEVRALAGMLTSCLLTFSSELKIFSFPLYLSIFASHYKIPKFVSEDPPFHSLGPDAKVSVNYSFMSSISSPLFIHNPVFFLIFIFVWYWRRT